MGDVWTRKYMPRDTTGVKGQDAALGRLMSFITLFGKQPKRAALIYGPPGCGKSAAVYAIASELGLELVELNASDLRNKDAIERVAGSASRQMSLFNKGKIILIDEIDGLAGREDRGGLQAVIQIIQGTSFPVVLTANDPFDPKFSKLRKVSAMVVFEKLDYTVVMGVLKDICSKEGIKYEETALEALSRSVDGDLRAAIIDLFLLTRVSQRLGIKDTDTLSDRRREISMLDALTRVFKTKRIETALAALNNVSEDLDEAMLWFDHNLPKEYSRSEDLARAYEALSKADVFRGRIRKWQYWRLLVYINALITVGVALAKTEKYKGLIRYERSKRILKIWIYNRKNMLRKAIAKKLAVRTHCSVKYAFHMVPYFKAMFSNKQLAERLTDELELDEKEAEWLQAD